jgi:hypothetical protein
MQTVAVFLPQLQRQKGSAKWIRFAVKNAVNQRRELLPRYWEQL